MASFNRQKIPSSSSQTSLLPQAGSAGHGPYKQLGPLDKRHDSVRSVSTFNSMRNPYSSAPSVAPSTAPSVSDKFSLSPNPMMWGTDLSPNHPEADDWLHNPDPRRDRKNDQGGTIFTTRGFVNLGFMLALAVGLVTLFAGYPIITYVTRIPLGNLGGFGAGGVNATGQVPTISASFGLLIDPETPREAMKIKSYLDPDGDDWELVFSDEFNTPNRSFYPGDDPFWEAVDLHYWATNNIEWYDPAAVTTRDGALKITLSRKDTHGLRYQGGMVTTWNKFCFTGGMILTSAQLPGPPNVTGLWPAVWTLGNLGRAGYGASLDGMWPYTYDTCDVGTLSNQTDANGEPTTSSGLSFLPGQRLSACTCPDEFHPGPKKRNGRWTGRAAPEIDVIEALVNAEEFYGEVSMSSQWAPFDAEYEITVNTNTVSIFEDGVGMNPYKGGVYQQATSTVSRTDQECYELPLSGGEGCHAIYGFQYKPGLQSDNAYITWIKNNQLMWTLNAAAMGPNDVSRIGARPIPYEPMYIIANLGMAEQFGHLDLENMPFPVTFSIDWIRVYQPPGGYNIGCDPKDFPTQEYINTYIEAYSNPNLTTWEDDYKQPFPRNELREGCA